MNAKDMSERSARFRKRRKNGVSISVSTLPSIDQLHNDKLRDRHWNKLEKVTGVNLHKSVDIKLGDILARDMMKYAEDITEIVDSANNEVRMETQLADLDKTWRDMTFQYKPMEEFPELQVLFVPEELVQTLEENQVAVQNYLSSKNIFLSPEIRSPIEIFPDLVLEPDEQIIRKPSDNLSHLMSPRLKAACAPKPIFPEYTMVAFEQIIGKT